jgi:hypothetical protein
MVMVPVLVKVTTPLAGAPTVRLRHASAPVSVTVYADPLAASKTTSSAAVGTLAPAVPPDVADHLVVLVVFHVPVPPTQ